MSQECKDCESHKIYKCEGREDLEICIATGLEESLDDEGIYHAIEVSRFDPEHCSLYEEKA